jgi:hypothetical protein
MGFKDLVQETSFPKTVVQRKIIKNSLENTQLGLFLLPKLEPQNHQQCLW